MFKFVRRATIIAILGALIYALTPVSVIAQIAPTNTAVIAGSVTDSAGKPVANARVTVSGPKSATTQTDSQGLFAIVGMPFGTYQLSVTSAELGTVKRTFSVDGDTNVAIEYQSAAGPGLKTIASVNANANAQFNITPASVTQVSPVRYALQGETSWRKILETIPGVSQAGLNFGISQYSALPDGPLMPMKISINGALPYETATLLDDMPLIGGSHSGQAGTGTDLGAYALNGFSSADVVRGPGANAPSIVDSIGGSFVLHSPAVVQRNHYDFSFSTDPYGGIVANSLIGVRFNRLSLTASYGINDSPGPVNGPGIVPLGTLFPMVNVNGFACKTCSASLIVSPNYSNFAYYGYSSSVFACCVTQSTAWSQQGGSLAADYAFSPSVHGSVFYTGQSSNVQAQPSQAFTSLFTPPAGYTGALPAGQSQFNYNYSLMAPASQQQTSSLLEEKIVAQIGRGVLRLGALQNRTYAPQVYTTPTSQMLQLFGGTPICSNTSPTCAGGTYVPTVFNGETYNVALQARNCISSTASNNRDLSASYTTTLGEALRAGVSLVDSYYNATSQLYRARIVPAGTTVTTGIVPPDVSARTQEARVFLGADPSSKVSTDLSMYFASVNYHLANPVGYSSVTGTSTNGWIDQTYSYAAPRLGAVWHPTASVAVRGAAGGGFAEVPLTNLIGSGGTPSCAGSVCRLFTTNVNLQPEKSFSFDIGTDIRIRRATVLSFDVYRSNLFGQLYSSTTTTGSCPTCAGQPLFVTQIGNLGQSRYEGVLLDLRHEATRGVYWALSGGLTRGYVVSVPAGFYNDASGACNFTTGTTPSGAACPNLNVVPGVNFNGSYTNGLAVPYSQGLGTLGYRWSSDKSVELTAAYFGNNNSYFRPAFVELDGRVAYPVSRVERLLLTFRNITGIYGGAFPVESPSNLIGVPTLAGLPYAEYGQEYGPRTVLLTLQIHG